MRLICSTDNTSAVMSCSKKSAELSSFDLVKLSGKVAHIYLSDGDIGEGAGDEVEVGPARLYMVKTDRMCHMDQVVPSCL